MTLFFIAFLASYLYHGLGITIGYHRLLSHRAFRCPRWLEYVIVSGGYLAFEGSPVSWVATHRTHHRFTDRDGDPHKPADGFWHSFAGWLVRPKVVLSGQSAEQICPDLWRDKLYRFLDLNHSAGHALLCLIICLGVRAISFCALGPGVLAANLLGTLLAFIAPFCVNSFCHLEKLGYRNFETNDVSRNVWWVGILALGEGWHNNHHAVPQSARHGMTASEIDASWLFIRALEKLGLVTGVHLPGPGRSVKSLSPQLAERIKPAAHEGVQSADPLVDGGQFPGDATSLALSVQPDVLPSSSGRV
jgi:fatty-acid desaturase